MYRASQIFFRTAHRSKGQVLRTFLLPSADGFAAISHACPGALPKLRFVLHQSKDKPAPRAIGGPTSAGCLDIERAFPEYGLVQRSSPTKGAYHRWLGSVGRTLTPYRCGAGASGRSRICVEFTRNAVRRATRAPGAKAAAKRHSRIVYRSGAAEASSAALLCSF